MLETLCYSTPLFSIPVITNTERTVYRHDSDKGIVIEWQYGSQKRRLFVYDYMVKNKAMLANNTLNGNQYTETLCTIFAHHYYHTTSRTPFCYESELNRNSAQPIGEFYLYYPFEVNSNPCIGNTSTVGSDDNIYQASKDYAIEYSNVTVNGRNICPYINVGTWAKSSRELCNFWLSLSIGSPLIEYARSINISGLNGGLDVPSFRELMTIVCENYSSVSSYLKGDLYDIFINNNISNIRLLTSNSQLANYEGNNRNHIHDMVFNKSGRYIIMNWSNMVNSSPSYNSASDNYWTFLVRDLTKY